VVDRPALWRNSGIRSATPSDRAPDGKFARIVEEYLSADNAHSWLDTDVPAPLAGSKESAACAVWADWKANWPAASRTAPFIGRVFAVRINPVVDVTAFKVHPQKSLRVGGRIVGVPAVRPGCIAREVKLVRRHGIPAAGVADRPVLVGP
jgi:hypothetical protein